MAANRKWKPDFWFWLTAAITLVLLVFLAYPLFTLFIRAFQDSSDGSFSMGNFARFFSKNYYMRVIDILIIISLLSPPFIGA